MYWLSDVRESVQPLTERSPIWGRHGVIGRGPTIPHPERHPYCEFGTIVSGEGIEFVEREEAARAAGDVFLTGPGVMVGGRGCTAGTSSDVRRREGSVADPHCVHRERLIVRCGTGAGSV